MASPTFFARGHTPTVTDTRYFNLQRILGATIDGGGGGGGGSNNISGAGSPIGVRTPDAIDQQYRDNTNDTYWWATGLTNADWTQFV